MINDQDKRCYITMIRFNKGWEWLKLNHIDTWKKYKKRTGYPQVDINGRFGI